MLCVSENIRTTKTTDGAIVLDIQQNRLLSLNLLGATILELIRGEHSERQIVEEISGLYAVPLETVCVDVRTYIDELIRLKILSETAGVSGRGIL